MKIIKSITFLFLFLDILLAQIDSKIFLENAFITDIKRDRNLLLVATYGQGIYEYSLDEGKWKNFSTKTGDLDNDLFHCVASSKDFIWAGSNEGLYIYNRKTNKWTSRKFAAGGEFGNWIRALYFDELRNILWIGRFRNVTMYDVKSNSFREFNRIIGGDEKTNNINCIAADGDSVLWFGAEYGVHKLVLDSKNQFNTWSYFNNKTNAFLGQGDMVSISAVLPLKNSIWFGTEEFITPDRPQYNIGGIYINNRRFDWKRVSKSEGLSANGIFKLARIGNQILVSLYEFNKNKKAEIGKGLALVNVSNFKVNNIDLNQFAIRSSEIRAIYFDGEYLWLGASAGLISIKIANSLAKWGIK